MKLHNLENISDDELMFLLDAINYFPIVGKEAMFVSLLLSKIVAKLEKPKEK